MAGLIPLAMLGGAPAATFEVLNSGAFAAEESDLLEKTFSAGNRKTWTFSCFLKRSEISAYMHVFGQTVTAAASGYMSIRLDNVDTIFIANSATGGPADGAWLSTGVFRDVAEFYHIFVSVDTTSATTADRIILYINGKRASGTMTVTPSLNLDMSINKASDHQLGMERTNTNGKYFDGYMSEVYFIDGQALTPEDFAEEDEVTGQWNPIEYVGTYGDNGFYLDFEDGTDLGKDVSGNANDFTNTGVTQSTDTPTDNHNILNSLNTNTALFLENSGLTVRHPADAVWRAGASTLATPLSGKWYWEMKVDVVGGRAVIGVDVNSDTNYVSDNPVLGSVDSAYTYGSLGKKAHGGTTTAYGATFTTGDIVAAALDVDSGTIEFFKNNVSQGVAFTSMLAAHYFMVNYGFTSAEQTFRFTEDSWTYSPPSGFKALTTKNFPTPDIVLPEEYFKSITYDDGAGAKSVGFQPDLVWMKSRGSAFNHKLVDSVRGATKALSSDDTTAEVTDSTGLTSFDVNGFTVGADTDYSDTTGVGMVAWSWKEGVTPGFDIVTYTGNGSSQNISHSLSAVPDMMLIKLRNAIENWAVYHDKMSPTAPEGFSMALNLNNASAASIHPFNNTKPTSSVFSIGATNTTNKSGGTYVAYLFASIEGFSKFGAYTGNGLADGPFVHCGFIPAYLMIKRADSIGDWLIVDVVRGVNNVVDEELFANTTAIETTNDKLDILSNGFKIRNTAAFNNASGGTYIFMAFAESPFQYSRSR